ncbi:gamma-glutamyltransferase [Aquibaculum arenosum]|uniref:Glutathione hydrolase proenzyme n=1 Tax=Aquibaculum arenosum TaxID=3032591 RepID=A0ABT5YJ35_9PROT|nr:gamma-glutamyltransferase [Fodinicurvata sp. CAU 1616]MDF2094956.1 gamma-glutamyltransferase [Fodinicurvata sp. CAU 1616]
MLLLRRRVFSALLLTLSIWVMSPAAQAEGRSPEAMVAAANPLAVEAGVEMLRAGGSAVDAAIAVQLVLGLVEPQSSGIGGGAFLLHYGAEGGAIQAYDGRETAPMAAGPDLFLDEQGQAMDFWEAVVGGRSVGTPGLLRMLELAHETHGKLPWGALFAPAIRLAEEGFAISPRLAGQIAADEYLQTDPTARAYFYTAEGAPKPAGTPLRNPDYAESLRRIAEGGANAFYSGAIAADIVAKVQGAENPGLLSEADLTAYEAKERTALCGSYRAYEVCGMSPPTSGGVAVLQIMGMLENFELSGLAPDGAEAVHLLTEASRLAFADRNAYLADSDFVAVPLERLLDPTYLRQRAALIQRDAVMDKAEPGRLPQRGALAPEVDTPSTSHLVVVDAAGNAVSMTSSVESAFGSRLMVRGFLLNNQLTDFSFLPEIDGKEVANRVEPGKRPRSSMSPTLVFDPEGAFHIAAGSPGGARIIGYTVNALLGMLEWDLDPQEAVARAHAANLNGPTLLEAGSALEALEDELQALGHETRVTGMTSGLHVIRRGADGLEGGADPRREGIVAQP